MSDVPPSEPPAEGGWQPPAPPPATPSSPPGSVPPPPPSPSAGYVPGPFPTGRYPDPTGPAVYGTGRDGRFSINGYQVSDPWKRIGAAVLDGVLAMVTLGIGWLIWGLIVAADGYTPARKLLKMRTVRVGDGRAAGYYELLVLRGIVLAVLSWMAFFGVAVLTALFPPFVLLTIVPPLTLASAVLLFTHERTATVADLLSRTAVVDEDMPR